jgi:hypothetical protein
MTPSANQGEPKDDLDDLLAEFSGPDGPEPHAGAEDDQAETSPEPGNPDPLDTILGEIGTIEVTAADGDEPGAGQMESDPGPDADVGLVASSGDAGDTASRISRRFSRVRKLLMVLAGSAVLVSSHAASYFLGARSEAPKHAQGAGRDGPHAARQAPPAAKGAARYVGLPANARINGKTIFESEEIKSAITQLVGGMDLQSDIAAASRRYTSATPTDQIGNIIKIRSCNQLDCARDNIRIHFNIASNTAKVCMTKPYSIGNSVSIVYNQNEFHEVASCDGNPFIEIKPKEYGN